VKVSSVGRLMSEHLVQTTQFRVVTTKTPATRDLHGFAINHRGF
jgi:hypothetical protein